MSSSGASCASVPPAGTSRSGATIIFTAAYLVISFWQWRQVCNVDLAAGGTVNCYDARDPLDTAVLCAAMIGACVGFLWWNTSPAKIFMGDTGVGSSMESPGPRASCRP